MYRSMYIHCVLCEYSISSVVNYYTEQEAKDEIAKLIKRDLAWRVVKSEVIK